MKNNYIIDTEFTTKDGDRIGIPNVFVYEKIMFKNYEILVFDGEEYLVGNTPNFVNKDVQPDTANLGDITATIYCKDAELLFSLLGLYDKLSHSEQYTSNDVKLIKKWCIKYGLPIEGTHNVPSTNRRSLWMTERKIGFSIRYFISSLNELEETFKLVLHLTGCKVLDKWWVNDIEYCKHEIKHIFSQNKLTTTVIFEDLPYFEIRATDLFKAALYQLMQLAINPARMIIKVCECCGSYFLPKRGNKKYCDNCNSSKHYMRKKRAKSLAPVLAGATN